MPNPGLPNSLWMVLDQRLWHATAIDALQGIVGDGAVKIKGCRYKNSLCRHLDGVSLFDFGPTAVDDWGQLKNWRGWFGSQQGASVSVWLEIDRCITLIRVHDAGALHRIWKKDRSRTFIPGVEACHLGSIPLAAVKGALLIDRYNLEHHEYHENVDESLIVRTSDFEKTLSSSDS